MADIRKLRADLLAVIDKAIAGDTATVPPVVPPLPPTVATGYTTRDGKIYDGAGQRVWVRGISHHGANGDVLRMTLLWVQDWIAQLEQMKELGFTAIRVPFVPHTLYDERKLGSWSFMVPGAGNDTWQDKTPLQALDMWMAKANEMGFHIMLDFHSIGWESLYGQWFTDDERGRKMAWGKQIYTQRDWIRDLVFVAERYAHLPRFFAIDVYNEANGRVRWNAGDANMQDSAYYFQPAVEAAAKAILAANPNLLICVQGIGANWDGLEDRALADSSNWGENLQAQRHKPLNIPAGKFFFGPHTYGPFPGRMKPSFSDRAFPKNLAADWEKMFGFIHPNIPVVLGEWGGKYEGHDKIWQDALVDYMISKDMRDSFYWCWANSGDTGSVIDNDGVVNEAKMALLKRLWG